MVGIEALRERLRLAVATGLAMGVGGCTSVVPDDDSVGSTASGGSTSNGGRGESSATSSTATVTTASTTTTTSTTEPESDAVDDGDVRFDTPPGLSYPGTCHELRGMPDCAEPDPTFESVGIVCLEPEESGFCDAFNEEDVLEAGGGCDTEVGWCHCPIEVACVHAPRNQTPCRECGKKPNPEPASAGPIGKLLKRNISALRRDSWKTMHDDEKGSAERNFLQAHSRKALEEAFDGLFPEVAPRGDVRPRLEELEALSKRVRAIAEDVRRFRNKVVAHRRGNAPTLQLQQVREVVDRMKPILWALYFVANPGVDMTMTLGGGANVKRFAAAFCELLSDPAGGPHVRS